MKISYLFLLLLLLTPDFSYAKRIDQEAVNNAIDYITDRMKWGEGDLQKSIEEDKKFNLDRPKAELIAILEKSLEHCQWAKNRYEEVLQFLASGQASQTGKLWRKSRRETAQKNIEICNARIQELTTFLSKLHWVFDLPEVQDLFDLALKASHQGLELYKKHENAEANVDLNKAACLFEEAVAFHQKALGLMITSEKQEDLELVAKELDICRHSAKICREKAPEQPETESIPETDPQGQE